MLPIAWQADCDVLLCVKSYKRRCLNRLNLHRRRSKQRDIRCLGTAAHKRLLPSIFLHFHPAVLEFLGMYNCTLSASRIRCTSVHLFDWHQDAPSFWERSHWSRCWCFHQTFRKYAKATDDSTVIIARVRQSIRKTFFILTNHSPFYCIDNMMFFNDEMSVESADILIQHSKWGVSHTTA